MQKTAHELGFTDGLETVPDATRRDFLTKLGKGALLASLGMFGAGCEAVDRGLLGRGLTPIVLVEAHEAGLPKSGMLVHSQNPFNGEFAPHLLNDDITRTARHFVRNNSGIPERSVVSKPKPVMKLCLKWHNLSLLYIWRATLERKPPMSKPRCLTARYN